MIRGFPSVARIAMLAQCCTIACAFQAPLDGPVQIVPRAKPVAPEAARQPLMRVASSLVLIPVHVTEVSGTSVTGLKKEDFLLFEDGVPQVITHFAQDDAPLSAGVLLDTSGSMKNKMALASQAATSFFQFANPADEFFLVEFNSRPKLKAPFTHEWNEIVDEIGHAKAFGQTAMLDAIHLALAQMKHARNVRKALIVLSDGGDNFSRRNFNQLKSTLIEADVQVYAMGIFDRNYAVKHTSEERNGPRLLDQVAIHSGGRDFPIIDLEDLPQVGVQMARDLRNQYVLGYSPTTLTTDGKYHHVELQLAPQYTLNLRAHYRSGYYAPNP